ncbi:TonB-dependent receptor [Paraglaciecola sp. 20A4]|uniref:TonB-dependent receptor n=1 Tax=Paraglaciecola sp. 20A4 TaxID=2687288 RepID=UPI0014090B48|nr:TonB-dependent receptor [Paraglaciecola sp. 20A4]
MKYKFYKKKAIAVAIGIATLSGTASAQQLEVITVTAQKRMQTLDDVPVSMQVVSGDLLENQNILDFGGLVERLPNVNLGTAPQQSSIYIRGVGTGNDNAAAEQSVGLYVDGMYVSRGSQFNAPFTDVERVEVLKGPQGILQGKNSVAGAIVITTTRPTDDFEASVRTSYEVENEGYNLEGIVSGAIADNFFARVVVQQNFVGGWLDTNTRTAANGVTVLNGKEDQNESEFSSFRLSLVWEPSDTLSLFGKVELGEKEVRGMSFGPSSLQPTANFSGAPLLPIYLSSDPNYDTISNGVISNGYAIEYNPDTNQYDASNKALVRTIDSASFTGQIDWEIELGTLTAITGYSEFDNSRNSSLTMAPLDWLYNNDPKGMGGEEFDQLTQEIRLVSPGGETFDYIVGAFYMDRNIEMNGATTIINFSNSGLPANPVFAFFDAANNRFFKENTESYSIFAQGTWNIADDFRVNVGARYTDETKKVNHDLIDAGFLVENPIFNPFALATFGVAYFTTEELPRSEVSDTSLDPSVSIQWDVTKDIMLYTSYTKATKAGGFNSSASYAEITSFDPETSTGYEMGLKGNFLEGRLAANVSLYNTTFDDLQVSALDPTTNSFFFKNAAEATTQGLEADIRYALTDDVEIGGALAYLDATYGDFPGASCSNGSSKEADCDDATASRNAKGDKLRFAPEWSANLYADYQLDLSNGMTFALRGDLIYSDDYFWGSQNDTYMLQEAFTKFDLSASLTNADGDWKVSLIAKNLTDETTVTYGGATPLVTGAYWSNVDAPRQIFLTAEYNWF